MIKKKGKKNIFLDFSKTNKTLQKTLVMFLIQRKKKILVRKVILWNENIFKL